MPQRVEQADDVPASGASMLPAWVRPAGVAIGIALLVAAIAAVISQRETMSEAWRALRSPSWPLMALLAGSVLANLVLSGLMFSALVSRYGRVGLIEMQALIAVASLLNFLPVRPGMFGRVAYHRVANGIRTVDAAKTVVQGAAISAGVALALAAMAVLCAKAGWPLWPMVTSGAIVLGLTPIMGLALPRPTRPAAAPESSVHGAPPATGSTVIGSALCQWSAAILCRYLDVLAWSLRYWAAFALIGHPINWDASVALACVGIIATMTPIGANGLGLREWAIGLAAPFVSESALETAIGADLLNRVVEMVVVLGAAGVGSVILGKLHGRGWLTALKARNRKLE